uniref:Uncharacterized protein LOC104218356 n=1 Tax=Nicotiana sylvestris TaxID=4096 RepID=A0A1U7VXM8_NICSY|nr:PREDICTED: uncharacterized protein LOC104218356 [Nicotiana sylvestris]
MSIKLVVGGFTVIVISAYASQVGLDQEVKRQFCEDLEEMVRGIPHTEKLFIGGDFNGYIGANARGYDDVHGGFGFGDRKRKVIPSEYLKTQHRLLVMDLEIRRSRRKRAMCRQPKIKWGKERGEVSSYGGEDNSVWISVRGTRGKKRNRLANVRERKARDLDQVKCIKDEDSKVLMDEAHIRRKWKTYFHKLLNKESNISIVLGKLEHSESRRDFRYCRRIKAKEEEEATRKMSRGRSTVPDKIPIEFWKNAGRRLGMAYWV